MSPLQSDRAVRALLFASLAVATAIMGLIVLFLAAEAWPALRAISWSRFWRDAAWSPSGTHGDAQFNLLPMLVGSFWVTLGAILLAAPVAWGTALYLHETACPRLAGTLRQLLALMAGMPSVVIGLWGLTVLVPWIRRFQPPGASLLAGILILAIMILPTVALITDASFRAIPRALLDGAAAAGLSKWGALRAVVLPSARSGMGAALVLGVGRALGETMAVLMVCGNVVQAPASLFDPVRTLTANIALEMAYAMDTHRAALFVSGLLLTLFVGLMVLTAHTLQEPQHVA